MPSYPCRHPTCTAYVLKRGDGCDLHSHPGARPDQAQRHRRYDQTRRDPEAKRFYDSAAWQRARAAKLAATPWCERCRVVFANTCHHAPIPLADCTPEQRTDQRNLQSLCPGCHSLTEVEERERQEVRA
jgi:5-methylcytosine-specific restriction protein A